MRELEMKKEKQKQKGVREHVVWRKSSRKIKTRRDLRGVGMGIRVWRRKNKRKKKGKKRKRNIWSVWMQEKKGKRIKNHNQMLPQYFTINFK